MLTLRCEGGGVGTPGPRSRRAEERITFVQRPEVCVVSGERTLASGRPLRFPVEQRGDWWDGEETGEAVRILVGL